MTDLDDARRRILSLVAAGQLDPGEAADRLATLDARGPAAAEAGAGSTEETTAPAGGPRATDRPSDAPLAPSPPTGDGRPVRRVRVASAFRTVEVRGDTTVQEAVAEGDHRANISGDTLTIDGESLFEDLPGAFAFHGGWGRPRVTWGGGPSRMRPLVVRMNPELDLDVEVSAGSVRVLGVHGEISARCSAGNLRIEGFQSPLDLTVAAGSISASGVLDSGSSHIQCDAGRVSVRLEEGSSVRVSSQANLGKVVVSGDREQTYRSTRMGGSTEHTVGAGEGELSIVCNLGAVMLDVER